MSAISLKSISGITSITTPAGVDNQFTLHNNNTTEAVKLDIAGNLHINNQLVVAGVTTFSDDVVVNFGTGNDLQIYHTSSTNRSYIKEVGSGGFYLQAANLNVMNPAGNETMLRAIPDGAVELYHNNIKHFETTNIGCKIYDDDTTAALQFQNSAGLAGLIMGESTNIIGFKDTNPHWLIKCIKDGAVELYHDNSKKLETSSTGITVTGTVVSTGADINGDLDVDGHTNLDNVSVAGVSTITGNLDTSTIDVTGTRSIGNDALQLSFSAPEGHIKTKNSSGSPASNLAFHTTDTSGNTNRVMHLRYDGNVGINETSPQQLLHVHNDTNYQGILINGNVAPRIAFARSTTTTGEWSVGIDGTNGNDFTINNSNDNSNRKFLIGGAASANANTITSLVNHRFSGNVIISNAGSGIDFSATADGGTGTPSELLDDYEEGYFAPEVTNLTSGYGSGTFYNRQARYTKVGNMVTCWVHMQWWGNAVTSGNNNTELSITGFPFEVDGVGYSGSCGGGLQAQSWRYAGTGNNTYSVDSHNVQPRINSLEQIRFGVCGHNGITGQVTQKSINGYSPNIEFCFTVRVTSYK